MWKQLQERCRLFPVGPGDLVQLELTASTSFCAAEAASIRCCASLAVCSAADFRSSSCWRTTVSVTPGSDPSARAASSAALRAVSAVRLPASCHSQRLLRLGDLFSQLRDLALRRLHFGSDPLNTQYILFCADANLFRRGRAACCLRSKPFEISDEFSRDRQCPLLLPCADRSAPATVSLRLPSRPQSFASLSFSSLVSFSRSAAALKTLPLAVFFAPLSVYAASRRA